MPGPSSFNKSGAPTTPANDKPIATSGRFLGGIFSVVTSVNAEEGAASTSGATKASSKAMGSVMAGALLEALTGPGTQTDEEKKG